jgi:hypothetical protein
MPGESPIPITATVTNQITCGCTQYRLPLTSPTAPAVWIKDVPVALVPPCVFDKEEDKVVVPSTTTAVTVLPLLLLESPEDPNPTSEPDKPLPASTESPAVLVLEPLGFSC